MFARAVVLLLVLGGCGRQAALARDGGTGGGPAPALIDRGLITRGAAIYAQYCATCHGPNGYGYVADNAPSLRTATFLATATAPFLQAAILRGRPGTAMGGYARATGGPLSPEDADAIIAFLRDGGPPLVVLPAGKSPGDPGRGQAVYERQCRRCHGTETQRVSAVHLANPILLETASDAFLRYAVENGRPPTSMVPWKGALSPQEIEDVVAYLRSMAKPAPAAAAPPLPGPAAAPRTGPVVLNPKGRPPTFTLREGRFVPSEQVKKALDQKRRLVIADARGPAEWSTLHIAGAISVPYYDTHAMDQIPNDDTWVIAYCGCPHHLSGDLVDALRKRGFKNTAVLDEGIFFWQQKGYPVVAAPGSTPPPAPPPAGPLPHAPPPPPPASKR
jgi:cytochrome c oxidase cbb3-type subunit 3/ubiquinol-cytochrome c reductase cytochrome c subunit